MSDTPAAPGTQYPPPHPPEPYPAPTAGTEFPAPVVRPRPEVPPIAARQAVWLLVAAVLANLAMRSDLSVISSTLTAVVIAVPLLGVTYRQSRSSTFFAATALVFALLLPLRASTWLTWLNTVAAVAGLVAASATVRPLQLRLSTKTIVVLVQRITMARFFGSVLRQATGPLRVSRLERLVPVLRGLAIAVVPVMVLGALLASADEVFAQAFSPELDPSGFFEHLFLTLFAVALIAGLIAITGTSSLEHTADHRPLGATEALVLLLSVGGLYAAFAVTQLRTALGRTDHLLDERNLSYAEYARSGFFQLLWVAGLTVILLTAVRAVVADGDSTAHSALRLVGAGVSLLTILIVAVAIVRLGLYTDEFGQTTLRWYCTAFAWMLGALFVVLAAGHFAAAERLLPPAALGLVALTLLAVNVLNPEARVAHHNLNRVDAAESLDADYLTRLSADAWPEILDHAPLVTSRLVGGENQVAMRCGRADAPAPYGVLGFNLARARLHCDN